MHFLTLIILLLTNFIKYLLIETTQGETIKVLRLSVKCMCFLAKGSNKQIKTQFCSLAIMQCF